MTIVLTISLLVAGVVVGLAIAAAPRGSGGAPGEVSADRSLTEDTPADWDGRHHAGGAEDRPAGPDVEPQHPDALGGSHRPPDGPA